MTIALTLLFAILISSLAACLVHEKWNVHRQAHKLRDYLDPDSLSFLLFSWAKRYSRQRRRPEDDIESNHAIASQMLYRTHTPFPPPTNGLHCELIPYIMKGNI